ncbi:DsbA family protein [Tardiphaga sp. P9-11]|jgi:protein-disulfide isomerase|uniref:DsbA family protein n=1 Tax=Tardiphaga sp. P9-11 TaxID=2024614 RepID=UPI0011F0C1B7|nr:DsbA family protein [Tardiphaga sp. P9-11]KAA0072706.1 DsbA family protein [Tardiphaga sp. P9-11]
MTAATRDSSKTATTRRAALGLFGGAMLLGASGKVLAAAGATKDQDVLNEAAVLRDPDIPAAGNPKGDITIVEFFDYQCPYCRKIAPDLRALVKEDGKVRLVSKDWPILGPVSVYAARLVLAARYQNKFIEAQDALISLDTKLTEAIARDRLAKAGIDVDRAVADLQKNQDAIVAKLKQIDEQATAFGFNGTPSFIVGKFRIPGPITKEQFVLAIADARKAAAAKK